MIFIKHGLCVLERNVANANVRVKLVDEVSPSKKCADLINKIQLLQFHLRINCFSYYTFELKQRAIGKNGGFQFTSLPKFETQVQKT